jgi:hypothetical protein
MPSDDLFKMLIIPQLLIGLFNPLLERTLEPKKQWFCIDSGRQAAGSISRQFPRKSFNPLP